MLAMAGAFFVAACGNEAKPGEANPAGPNPAGPAPATVKPAAGTQAPADSADRLKELVATIVAANKAGDHKKAASLTRDLLLAEEDVKKALRDDAPPAVVEMALSLRPKVQQADDAKAAALLDPGQPDRTEIQVHAATTEELAKYQDGSVAQAEFPSTTKALAERALRPGVRFHEVEFLAPGKTDGMKYHLFFFDGARWRMLGPVWRALK